MNITWLAVWGFKCYSMIDLTSGIYTCCLSCVTPSWCIWLGDSSLTKPWNWLAEISEISIFSVCPMAVFVCVRRISGLFENNNGVCLCINNQLVIRLKISMYIYSGSGQTHVWNVMKLYNFNPAITITPQNISMNRKPPNTKHKKPSGKTNKPTK